MNRSKHLFLLFFLVLFFLGKAQLNGVYSVPGSFTSIAASINALNQVGVSGAVTINIVAGYTETVPFGGLILNSITGANAANTVTFKKSGNGPNPLISAYSGGSGTPLSATNQDGIWKFVGADYVTVDGMDLIDPNTSNPSTMEYGFGFFKTSTSDGCIYNTIQNCNITLNRINAAAGAGQSSGGSKGIYMIDASPSSQTITISGITPPATNSYNKFYANLIQNCQTGISIKGYDGQGLYDDRFNDIGGLTAATGNTIVNFGGVLGNTECIGIEAVNQYSFNASNNLINNNTGAGFDPANLLTAIKTIYVSASNLSINNNSITLSATPGNTLVMNGITNIATSSTSINPPGIITINNNVFSSYSSGTITSQGPLQRALIYSSGITSSTSINNNLIQNVNTGHLTDLIYCDRAYTCTINSNTISSISFMGNLSAINSNAYNHTSNLNVINNVLPLNTNYNSGITSIGGGNYSNLMSINSNSINNILVTSFCGVCFNSNPTSNAQYTITENEIKNISSVTGATSSIGFTGIYINNNSPSSSFADIIGNRIYSLTSMGAVSYTNGGIYNFFKGIYTNKITYSNISRNKITSFYSDRFASRFVGIQCSNLNNISNCPSCINYIHNNLIGDFENTNTDAYFSAIETSERNQAIYFNTINFSSQNTGSNTISSGLNLNCASSATTFSANIINNIIVNLIPSTGTGTAHIVSISGHANYLGNFSNRNIYYVGTPSSNRLIARINNSSYQTITAYKAAVAPRESQTFTENPVFISTVGISPNYLNLNPTVTTLAENGALALSGFTTDYAGNTRHVNNPDIGAWEGNFAGFDRVAPLIVNSGFTSLPCNNFTNRTFTLELMDTSGVLGGGSSPRLYYKVNNGTYTSVQGTLTAGTATNGVWTFNMVYSASAGAIISYYFLAQDNSSFNNLFISPSPGAAATGVNSVQSPPFNPYTYTLQNFPTISVNSGSICAGQTFTINAFGASTYTYSSGSNTVNPLVNSSYTITGTSSNGCPATNTVVCNVTVNNVPTVSVNSGTICKGNSFVISPSGATTYTVQGGNWVVSPVINTNYTVVGKSSAGCLSSNTAVCNVTVIPLPAIYAGSNTATICVGEAATLTASGGVGNYTFNPGGVGSILIISPTVTTIYTITGTDANGCSSNISVFQVVDECAGFTSLINTAFMEVFPNPTKGDLKVNLSNTTEISIYNSLNQQVFQITLHSGNHEIHIESLSTGIYLLKLVDGMNTKNLKLIKE